MSALDAPPTPPADCTSIAPDDSGPPTPQRLVLREEEVTRCTGREGDEAMQVEISHNSHEVARKMSLLGLNQSPFKPFIESSGTADIVGGTMYIKGCQRVDDGTVFSLATRPLFGNELPSKYVGKVMNAMGYSFKRDPQLATWAQEVIWKSSSYDGLRYAPEELEKAKQDIDAHCMRATAQMREPLKDEKAREKPNRPDSPGAAATSSQSVQDRQHENPPTPEMGQKRKRDDDSPRPENSEADPTADPDLATGNEGV